MNLIKKLQDKKIKINLPIVIDEPLNIDATDQYTVGGAKNSGKSYLLSYVANKMPSCVLFDSRWERYTKKDKRAISEKALQMPDKWEVVYSPEHLRLALYRGKTHIIYHPEPLRRGKRDKKDLINEFDDVCQIIFEWKDIFFVIDEADNVCDSHHVTEGFHNIMEYGKHANIGIMAGTRRLQHLNPRVPRLSSGLFIFRISAKDFKYIYEFLPSDEYKDNEINNSEYNPHNISYEKNLRKKLTQQDDRYYHYFDGKQLQEYEPIKEEII